MQFLTKRQDYEIENVAGLFKVFSLFSKTLIGIYYSQTEIFDNTFDFGKNINVI